MIGDFIVCRDVVDGSVYAGQPGMKISDPSVKHFPPGIDADYVWGQPEWRGNIVNGFLTQTTAIKLSVSAFVEKNFPAPPLPSSIILDSSGWVEIAYATFRAAYLAGTVPQVYSAALAAKGGLK